MRVVRATFVLLVLACPGAAASLAIEAVADAQRLQPGSGAKPVTYTVTDDCQDLLLRSQGGNAVVVEVGTSGSPFVTATHPSRVEIDATPCLAGAPSASAGLEATVSLTPDAPGLEILQATAVATLPATALADARSAESDVAVIGEPVFRVEAKPLDGSKLVAVAGDTASAILVLANFGNVKTTVAMQASSPHGSVEVPEAVAVDTAASGLGDTVEVPIKFHAPGGRWGQVAVAIELTPSAFVDDGLAGPPTTVNLLFRNTDDVERAVPAAGLAPASLALLAVLLAWRRRA